MVSKRTKATSISNKVRQAVKERDSIEGCPCCIFCGNSRALEIAHYIPRSGGGLGIEENLACACVVCHSAMDQTVARKHYLSLFEKYLKKHYPNWDREKLIYRR